ncbi:MAG: ABC transporter ATP-binding protein [Syntrophomonadaceae bacterium]|nr:ABC transporter ATP-binding protein [Syntrophomonadaceae bacterium]
MLELTNVSCGYGKRIIVRDISFTVKSGKFVCILGPNGCGKTTLLKTVLGILQPFSGAIMLGGRNISCMRESELGQLIGYIPQVHTPPFPFSVLDVVLMGRTPHLSALAMPGKKDKEIAAAALDELNITYLKDQKYTRISGGERQLVLIARALAQQPRMLVMDEPTSSLDFGNQNNVLEKMSQLSRKGMSILMVTHNPDHALFCADKVVMMKDGNMLKKGLPEEIVSEESIQDIYNTRVKIGRIRLSDGTNIRVCVPVPPGVEQRRGA